MLKRHYLNGGVAFLLCVCSVGASAESDKQRLDQLESQQKDMFEQMAGQRGLVKSFLQDQVSLGGFFESGITAIGGADTAGQVSSNAHIIGINLSAEIDESIRFNSQIMSALGFMLQNPHNNPGLTVLSQPNQRRFTSAVAITLVAQGYLEYAVSPMFVVQSGLGYVPFGSAFQQREPVLFLRRNGPQMLGLTGLDSLSLVSPLWMGLHIRGATEGLGGHWGYNAYTFTPSSNSKTLGGGARLWAALSEAVSFGVSSQIGKRSQDTFNVIGGDVKLKFGPLAVTAEYAQNFVGDDSPWSFYVEPSWDLGGGKVLVYGVADYADNSVNGSAVGATRIEDPYRQWRYGGGLNWLPHPYTRFRAGFLLHDYVGDTATIGKQDRDMYSLDLSVGVAF